MHTNVTSSAQIAAVLQQSTYVFISEGFFEPLNCSDLLHSTELHLAPHKGSKYPSIQSLLLTRSWVFQIPFLPVTLFNSSWESQGTLRPEETHYLSNRFLVYYRLSTQLGVPVKPPKAGTLARTSSTGSF